MTDKDDSPFKKALNMEASRKQDDKPEEGAEQRVSTDGAKRRVLRMSERRAKGARTTPFNHRVDKATVEGLVSIALQNDWTMNRTLTEAYALLAKAQDKGGV